MGVTARAARARMAQKSSCDWQAFTGKDGVGGVGVAQVVEPYVVWQVSATSDAVPERVDLAPGSVGV